LTIDNYQLSMGVVRRGQRYRIVRVWDVPPEQWPFGALGMAPLARTLKLLFRFWEENDRNRSVENRCPLPHRKSAVMIGTDRSGAAAVPLSPALFAPEQPPAASPVPHSFVDNGRPKPKMG
jgi:hypothetical protein